MKNIISVLFLGLLFFPLLARAESGFVLGNTNNDSTDSMTGFEAIGQTFNSGNITDFDYLLVDIIPSWLPVSPIIHICEGDPLNSADFSYGDCNNKFHSWTPAQLIDMGDGTMKLLASESHNASGTAFISDTDYFLYFKAQSNFQPDYTFTIGYSNIDWSGGYSFYLPNSQLQGTSPSNVLSTDLYFEIYAPIPSVLSIISPSLQSHIPIEEITVLGTCPVDGSDVLAIGNTAFDVIHYLSSDFTIDCVDSNFSYTFEVKEGFNQTCVFTEEAIETYSYEYYNCVTFTGADYTEDYVIEISSPNETALNHYDLFAEQDFPFNFHYISEDIYDINFRLRSYTDNTYTVVSSIIANQNLDYFESFDGVQDGYFWLPYGIDVNVGVTEYYRIDLYSSSTLQIYDSNVFSVTGTSNLDDQTGNDAIQPDIIYGYCNTNPNDNLFQTALKQTVCWAIIGDYETRLIEIKEKASHIRDDKIPTAYFFEIKNSFENVATSSSMMLGINFNHLGLFDGTIAENINITFIDLANPGFSFIMWTILNYIENSILPLLLTVLIIMMIVKIFRKETH